MSIIDETKSFTKRDDYTNIQSPKRVERATISNATDGVFALQVNTTKMLVIILLLVLIKTPIRISIYNNYSIMVTAFVIVIFP
jgi:hypothetical protein